MSGLLNTIDLLIRERKYTKAKKEISKVCISKIPTEQRMTYSNFARRLHLNQKALKILWPNIHELGRMIDAELCEYASALRSHGLINEALEILGKAEPSVRVDMYKAFCHISSWNYEAAIVWLLSASEKNNFQNQDQNLQDIILVNLAGAYLITGDLTCSEKLLNQLETEGIKERNRLLFVNVLENKAHLKCMQDYPKRALSYIKQAFEINGDSQDYYSIMLEKWKVIAELMLDREEPEKIDECRRKIRASGHWESLRDFDFHLARLLNDQALAEKVYFGTPYLGFKKRMESHLSIRCDQSIWFDQRKDKKDCKVLDFYSLPGQMMPSGLTLHRFLLTLASDRYRPWSVGRIFDCVYAGAAYNPACSAKRVQQLVNKARKAFEAHDLAIEINSTKSGYRLRPVGDVAFSVFDQMNFGSQGDFVFQQIQSVIDCKNWSSRQDLQEAVKLSSDQWYRLLRSLKEAGKIETKGIGKGMKYRLNAS